MRDQRTVHVVVDETISEAGVDELADLFATAGLDARVEATYRAGESERVSAAQKRDTVTQTDAAGYFEAEQSWTILVYAHANQLLKELGYERARNLFESIRSSQAQRTGHPHNSGLILLVDEESGIRVNLESQLPRRAYESLRDLRFATFKSDPLSYERTRGHGGRWRSPW